MKLRPYHNPENIDESKVPDGWRFRYADELQDVAEGLCIQWHKGHWSTWRLFMGTNPFKTYIVPVES